MMVVIVMMIIDVVCLINSHKIWNKQWYNDTYRNIIKNNINYKSMDSDIIHEDEIQETFYNVMINLALEFPDQKKLDKNW